MYETQDRLTIAAPALLAALELAYEVLGANVHQWPGRHTENGQRLLSTMRDAICAATGREQEEVQDDYCNRYLKARA